MKNWKLVRFGVPITSIFFSKAWPTHWSIHWLFSKLFDVSSNKLFHRMDSVTWHSLMMFNYEEVLVFRFPVLVSTTKFLVVSKVQECFILSKSSSSTTMPHLKRRQISAALVFTLIECDICTNNNLCNKVCSHITLKNCIGFLNTTNQTVF